MIPTSDLLAVRLLEAVVILLLVPGSQQLVVAAVDLDCRVCEWG